MLPPLSRRIVGGNAAAVPAAGPVCMLNPACVNSKSRMARSRASASLRACSSRASRSSCSRAFSARLISRFWARMLLSAHSRQKMSPCRQATGSTAGSRHSQHEAKGRKESRERRAEDEPQAARATARSWDVKTGLLVFLLPATLGRAWEMGWWWGRRSYCVPCCLLLVFVDGNGSLKQVWRVGGCYLRFG